MDQGQKDGLLQAAQAHVGGICESIGKLTESTARNIEKDKEDFKTMEPSDQVMQAILLRHEEGRLRELEMLYPSPYFVRCDIVFAGESRSRPVYFSKFQLSEEKIYSWTAPVATIRFEGVGEVTYRLPDGRRQTVTLLRRDQFRIVDGKIVFLATESEGVPRELIHQEHFSSRKQGFILPEIVAQMEKAQDQVIRAHHVGSFAISGPAGSGKTTLALHRVAYLVQSPDTTELYPSKSILVFVQDSGTQKYFAQLLPELGIRDVTITTFDAWAMTILSLSRDIRFVRHYGRTTDERDLYEYRKLEALHSGGVPSAVEDPFLALEAWYRPYLGSSLGGVFRQQQDDRVLDRIDMTALLLSHARQYGDLGRVHESYARQRNGKLRKKTRRVPYSYSLIVADEFQNFLPEQLRLFRQCVDQKLQSLIYVGDMAQKIRFGAVRNWEEIDEHMGDDRMVMLEKVYRNTKNILRYIRQLGFVVEIPEGMREGTLVVERRLSTYAEELEYVRGVRSANPASSLGILCKSEEFLAPFTEEFVDESGVNVFTMEESQGVEFDIVCIVGIDQRDWLIVEDGYPEDFVAEKRAILRDTLYIALTRAISELYITGPDLLQDIAQGLR